MPVAEIQDGKIVIRTQYHERHLIQQVPGARYSSVTQCWTVPLSWASCIILRGIFGDDFQVGVELATWSWKTYRERIEPALQLRNAMELPEEDPVAHIIDVVESRTGG